MVGWILFVLFLGAVLTVVFALGLRRSGPWAGWWWFFALVVLAGGMAAVWSQPVGPPLLGIRWVPIVFVALVMALVLAASTPARTEPPGSVAESAAAGPESAADRAAAEDLPVGAAGASALLWALLAAMGAAIIIGMFI